MNHFLPRRSDRVPKIGPNVSVIKKPLLPIQEASDGSPTVATWNLMTVFVCNGSASSRRAPHGWLTVLLKTAQQFEMESATTASHVFHPME